VGAGLLLTGRDQANLSIADKVACLPRGTLGVRLALPTPKGRRPARATWKTCWAGRVYGQTHHNNSAGRVRYDKMAGHAGIIIYGHELQPGPRVRPITPERRQAC
jgi:hypothetical protein